jgi:acyl-CoA synthetase (AMP-forming)/AMP-acid ligase II
LDARRFEADREAVIVRAAESGITHIVNPGVDLPSSRLAVKLAQQHECIYAAVGFHPHEAKALDASALEELRRLAASPKVVAIGEIGELVVKGPQVMKGYWNQPGETSMVLRNGWLHTGDIAKMDSNGFFFVVDRKKELIITDGQNVYPREVEEVLYQYDKIKEENPERGRLAGR